MATEYQLYSKTSLSSEKLLEHLKNNSKGTLTQQDKRLVRWSDKGDPILLVEVDAVASKNGATSLIASSFGFEPSVCVWFRIQTSIRSQKDSEQALITMLVACIETLRFSTDAVLLQYHETVILQKDRNFHELILSNNWLWNATRLAVIDMPFKILELTQPLL